MNAGPLNTIEVTLSGNAANVMLLDPLNYGRYQRGETFAYTGGHFTHSPALLRPPQPGTWYVVVDLGGAAGTVSVQAARGSSPARLPGQQALCALVPASGAVVRQRAA